MEEAPQEENDTEKDKEGCSNENASEESSQSQTCAYQKVILYYYMYVLFLCSCISISNIHIVDV